MRYLFMLLYFSMLPLAVAQSNNQIEAPKIITKMKIGQKLQVGEAEIIFSEVISDSRCPEDVTCVWAGEAKLLFQIEKNAATEEKLVVIGGSGGNRSLIFKNENLEVYVLGIGPKPHTKRKIKPNEYVVDLYILHLSKED